MKRIFTILIAFALMLGTAAAVVGHNNTDGDVSITSGSAVATTAVSENGTDYTSKVEMRGVNQSQTDHEIRNITYPHSKVEFEGTITAGTPCHVIDQELNKTGEKYVMNIKTVRDELDNGSEACAEVITGINYKAEFEAESGFQLEIQHNGETIETVSDRVVEPEPEPSLFQRILDFLGL